MSLGLKNKVPLRQCVGCREMKSKRDMIRILKTPEGEFMLDPTGRKNGRGAYICRDAQCLAKAKKSKAPYFRMSIPMEVYESLEREWEEIEEK